MKTQLLNSPARAARILRKGGLVAFPTETVYGLGVAIDRVAAVRRLFRAKGRPGDNPLIVHIAHRRQVNELAMEAPESARRLMNKFWPGPLTVILRRSAAIPDVVTAGLDTVGIRLPSHPRAHAFLVAAAVPVAAPSANRSGRPSPTSWQAVREDLDGRVDAILKGARSEVGLESSVVDCTGRHPVLLRAGAITLRQLQAVVPGTRRARAAELRAGRSPGVKHRHYAPNARVLLDVSRMRRSSGAGWIGLGNPPAGIAHTRSCRSVREYAREVFHFFRECEQRGINTIYCRPVAARGIGAALMDRLRRAAAGSNGRYPRASKRRVSPR